jgi:excisionase family DNA binding protein
MTPDRLLDVGTAARQLQVSAQTIRNWIRAGKLAAERSPSGRWRIKASLVAARKQEILQNQQP